MISMKDVYKRQVLAAFYKDGNMSKELSLNVDNRWGFFIRNVTRIARVTGSIITVSYTHLDVYKRQGFGIGKPYTEGIAYFWHLRT